MRIKDQPEKSYSLFSRFLFWLQRKKNGKIYLPTKIWGQSSWLYFCFSAFQVALTRKSSPISPTIRALINTYISQLNHCAFCIDLNTSYLEKLDIPEEKILSLAEYQTSLLFDEKEKAYLAYAEAITVTGKTVSDALYNRLCNHFDKNAIIELTALISFQNLSSKFNAALDIPAQGFCSSHLANNNNQ